MSRSAKKKKDKVPKMTEEQYALYVMSLKDEKPIRAYSEIVEESEKEKNGKNN